MTAPTLYKALNGVFCIFKPAGHTMEQVAYGIQTRLAEELNRLPGRPLRQRAVFHEENLDTDLPSVTTVPDLADHPLVAGPRYLREDFKLRWSSRLGKHSSGVTVMGVGRKGRYFATALSNSHQIRVYHVTGELGKSTQTFTPVGRLVENTTYFHVTHEKVDKMVAAMQAGHQRHMFDAAQVNIQSQEAYELASEGLLRPVKKETGPVIYNMKCIDFKPPNFTLEIHAVNEKCDDLASMIHQLGLRLKASAICAQRRRIRYGQFLLHHALLQKHWTLEHILENMNLCKPIVNDLKHSKSLLQMENKDVQYLEQDHIFHDDSCMDIDNDDEKMSQLLPQHSG